MNFRATSFSSSAQALKFSSQYRANILKYQQQISSGLRISRPSDDPVAFRQATSLSVRLQELQSESYAVVDSETKLNTSVSQLTAANELVVRARSLAQQGIQATSDTERNALATEVEGLLNSLQDISKTQSAGSFLFSGTRSDIPPFDFDQPAAPGRTLQVNYRGSTENSRAYIGDAFSVDTFFAGNEIFGPSGRGETVMEGSTGAQLGIGTDNMIGRATLEVRHSVTTFETGSGLTAATISPGNDTLLGAFGQNQITLRDTSGTGDFGTVQLNNGSEIAWTRSQDSLKITSNDGGELNVDMSNIVPGFDGVVNLESTGTLSADGGKTINTIDFSASQTVIDSITNTQVHIDTREIRTTGDELLEFPGSSNTFQTLYELAQDLRNTRGLSNQQQAAAIDRRLGDLGAQSDKILATVGRQSSALLTLSQLDNRIQDLQLEVESQINELQATDIPEAVLRMQNDQTLLEFTYSVTAQIASTNLLDFLR